jgi:hypothetical protein
MASLSAPSVPKIHATFRSMSCRSKREASSASSISESKSASAFSRALCFARRAPRHVAAPKSATARKKHNPTIWTHEPSEKLS